MTAGPDPSAARDRGQRYGWIPMIVVLVAGVLLGWLIHRNWTFRAQGGAAVEARAVTARGDLAADEKSTIELFRRTSPSVVFITTLARQVDLWTQNVMEVPRGTGSGFIWDTQGHVVTNFHVVQEANRARVTLADRSSYDATLVGAAPTYDLAVLRIRAPAQKLRPVMIGRSRDLCPGSA